MYRKIPTLRGDKALRRAQAPAKPWWRPLTNRWGILGLIIFLGLVLSLVEHARDWATGQIATLSNVVQEPRTTSADGKRQ